MKYFIIRSYYLFKCFFLVMKIKFNLHLTLNTFIVYITLKYKIVLIVSSNY